MCFFLLNICISSWSNKLVERSAFSASPNARGARQHAYPQGISGRERELESEFALIWLKSKSYASLMPLDRIAVCFRYLCSVSLLVLRIPFNARHFIIGGPYILFWLG